MQRLTALRGAVHRLGIDGVCKKRAVRDRVRDARQILKHHAAGANIRMADLAIAHLTVRQADVQPGGGELRVGAALQQAVHHRGLRRPDGVPGIRFPNAVAIQNHKRNLIHAHRTAPAQWPQ